MSVQVNFAPEQTAQFARLIDELNGTVKRNAVDAARFAGATFVYSCRAATPSARKTRRIVDNPAAPPAKAIQVYRQNGQLFLAPSAAPKSSPFYHIANRGLAKMIWTFAAVKAGLTKGSAEGATGGPAAKAARILSQGSKRTRDGMAEFEIANTAPYIVTLDQGGPRNPAHNILARGFAAASKRLEWILSQHARKMAGVWR